MGENTNQVTNPEIKEAIQLTDLTPKEAGFTEDELDEKKEDADKDSSLETDCAIVDAEIKQTEIDAEQAENNNNADKPDNDTIAITADIHSTIAGESGAQGLTPVESSKNDHHKTEPNGSNIDMGAHLRDTHPELDDDTLESLFRFRNIVATLETAQADTADSLTPADGASTSDVDNGGEKRSKTLLDKIVKSRKSKGLIFMEHSTRQTTLMKLYAKLAKDPKKRNAISEPPDSRISSASSGSKSGKHFNKSTKGVSFGTLGMKLTIGGKKNKVNPNGELNGSHPDLRNMERISNALDGKLEVLDSLNAELVADERKLVNVMVSRWKIKIKKRPKSSKADKNDKLCKDEEAESNPENQENGVVENSVENQTNQT